MHTEAEFGEVTTQFAEDVGRSGRDANEACLDLQSIADSNSVVVDLNCED